MEELVRELVDTMKGILQELREIKGHFSSMASLSASREVDVKQQLKNLTAGLPPEVRGMVDSMLLSANKGG